MEFKRQLAGNPFGQGGPMWDKCLTARHRAARLKWAQPHFRWGRQQWARVLFSDESRFNLSHHDGRIRVFRRIGERFADNCLIERDRFGGGSVMVCGGIMGRRKTSLIVVQRILATSMLKVTFLSFKGMGLQY